MPGGRPSKYDPKYCDEIIEYFDIPPYKDVKVTITKGDTIVDKIERLPNDLPTLAKFAANINVDRDTIHQWTKDHPEFSDAYKKAKVLQEHHLVTCGLNSLYNGPFAIFAAKNIIGWRDKQDIEHTGNVSIHATKLDEDL